MKRTLVIHGKDASTDFLIPIYKGMHHKTVITENCEPEKLIELIESHDRIMMLGHGWTQGLFNISGINKGFGFAINGTHASLLIDKECIFIWCQAHTFVEHFGLKGFNTGMFISEVEEASWYHIFPTQEEVDKSNKTFVDIFRKYRTLDAKTMHRRVRLHYAKLAKDSEVAEYNYNRLFNNK